MLPLRNFALSKPQTITELKEELLQASPLTKIMAGGTDMLPNLKHGLYDIDRIISLKKIKELEYLDITPESLSLGANITLDQISTHILIKKFFPGLSYAASQIASPQIRRMGTVGGNICLDTRCVYFNQSEFWRSALGYCLKKDGEHCHVVKTGKRCVAASCNDLGTMLLAHDATLGIVTPGEERQVFLRDFYTANGEKNNILGPQEVLTGVYLKRTPKTKAGFAKLRHRDSIDFPLLSIGVVFELDESNKLVSGRLVVSALVAKPKIFELDEFAKAYYTQDLAQKIARFAKEKCHPQTNIAEDRAWRKEMVECYILRAFLMAQSWGE